MLKLSGLLAAAGLALLLAALPLPMPRSDTAVVRGRAVFAGKGCAMCHAHAAFQRSGQFAGGPGAEMAPDLTHRLLDPDYLRRWLRDPAAVRADTSMPNLNLSDAEIEALVAFLRSDRGVAR